MESDGEQLVPVFIPTLGAVLLMAEDRKGESLTYEEVIAIRDAACCVMMHADDARKMEETRGWQIDPENCWYDWQQLRRELGRKPDLDPGPKFHQIRSTDPEYQRTIQNAQSRLDEFRRMLPADGSPRIDAMVKTKITLKDSDSFMWLSNVRKSNRSFIAEFFEIPKPLSEIKVGDRRTVAEEAVLDWMINDGGVLHGGFSLRYHRSRLPEDERQEYDEYIGVTRYA